MSLDKNSTNTERITVGAFLQAHFETSNTTWSQQSEQNPEPEVANKFAQ